MGSTLEAEHLELIAAIITIGVALQRTSRSDKIPFPDKKMMFVDSFNLETNVKRLKRGLH